MTIKPSSELLIGSSEAVFLMYKDRLAIANDVNASSDVGLKLKGEDKVGELESTEDKTAKNRTVEIFSYYDDHNDEEVTKKFFSRLQNAASSFLTDCDIDLIRPTPSSVIKKLNQTHKAAERLDKHLRNIDDRTRDLLVDESIDIESILLSLDDLLLACEVARETKPSARMHARTNLCLAVISALADLGVKVTTSRYGLVDSVVKHLAKMSTGGKVVDIQENIRAAMVKYKQLSK